jgi:hypothetical protein
MSNVPWQNIRQGRILRRRQLMVNQDHCRKASSPSSVRAKNVRQKRAMSSIKREVKKKTSASTGAEAKMRPEWAAFLAGVYRMLSV